MLHGIPEVIFGEVSLSCQDIFKGPVGHHMAQKESFIADGFVWGKVPDYPASNVQNVI
jgi:hypothetical protein